MPATRSDRAQGPARVSRGARCVVAAAAWPSRLRKLESGVGISRTRTEVQPDASARPCLRKIRSSSCLSTSRRNRFRARRGGNVSGRPRTSCSGSEQAGILRVISTFHWRFTSSGVCFKLLRKQIFSSLERAEKREGLRCFSLLPGRNRENAPDRGARRPIENRASRGGGQGGNADGSARGPGSTRTAFAVQSFLSGEPLATAPGRTYFGAE